MDYDPHFDTFYKAAIGYLSKTAGYSLSQPVRNLNSSAAKYLEELPVALIDTEESGFKPSEPSDPHNPPGNPSAVPEPFMPQSEKNGAPLTSSTLIQVAGSSNTPYLEVYPIPEPHTINSGAIPPLAGSGNDVELPQQHSQGPRAPPALSIHPTATVNTLTLTPGKNGPSLIPPAHFPKSSKPTDGGLEPTYMPTMQLGNTESGRGHQSQQGKSESAVVKICGCCGALKKLF
ncbi:hypothetical protein HYPSUDRAFT_206074 [Hypholoma sublateritium FD-334 SS-4]|uniref:Uncharacterized protein n=1 Tax=Hypholoma sublateritium (strain FD-334 SS-4) TaxID=945553 RepID=A0A0D2NF30_HYPSF|nr:hypothetical protein HYPSUDRAFT_206074 [Hypholoma sublateritium FD-334 SS-4]